MDILGKVVSIMTKEEVRAFKLFSQKMEMKEGRKDLDLFDYIRKNGEQYDEEAIIHKLYPEKPKNTYHRLRSRLLNEVNESLVHLHLQNNDTLKLYHLLSIADLYFRDNQFLLAHYYLKRGEKLARQMDQYEVLDIVYNEYIKLSRWVPEINPEEFIRLRRENNETLNRLRELEDIVSAVLYRVRTTQNYGAKENKVIQILQDTLDDFAVRNEGKLSHRQMIRIYELITLTLLEKRDYEALEDYLEETYAIFEMDGIFTKSTHETKLQMLSYRVNAAFKAGHLEKSLASAEVLGKEIHSFDGQYYEKYLFFWYNALVINYFEKDLDRALATLEEMKAHPVIQKNPYHYLFVHINQAIGLYNKGQYQAAIKTLVRSSLLEGFESAGAGLQLKMGVAEILIRYQLDEFEVIVNRIHHLRSDYAELLQDPGFAREKQLLQIILKCNAVMFPHKDEEVIAEIAHFKSAFPKEEDASEFIDYDAFLDQIVKGR